MRVYKYSIDAIGKLTRIEMPIGAKVVCVKYQAGKVTLWAIVHPENAPEIRRFFVVVTGHEFPEWGTKYVGTCFQRTPTDGYPNGFVWHVFER